MYTFHFAETVEILPISFNLTMTGINKTSFKELKSDLENAVADMTNISPSSVTAAFIEMVPILSTRLVNRHLDEEHANVISKRSKESGALINVALTPMDRDGETVALDIINDTASFRVELNTRLENHSAVNATVTSISPIQRVPGKFPCIYMQYRFWMF